MQWGEGYGHVEVSHGWNEVSSPSFPNLCGLNFLTALYSTRLIIILYYFVCLLILTVTLFTP